MSTRVFVGNLAWTTGSDSLREAFLNFGNVEDARVVIDRYTNRSRGFGFVTFSTKKEAEDAIQAMNGKDLDGRTIRCDFATERTEGGSGSGFRGEGYNSSYQGSRVRRRGYGQENHRGNRGGGGHGYCYGGNRDQASFTDFHTPTNDSKPAQIITARNENEYAGSVSASTFAGAIIVGPSNVIELLTDAVNVSLRKNREYAVDTLKKMKACLGNQKESPFLKKAGRLNFKKQLALNEIDLQLLAKTEFIQTWAVSVTEKPGQFLKRNAAKFQQIFEAQEQEIGTYEFLSMNSWRDVDVHRLWNSCFNLLNEKRYQDGYSYILGMEPVSINSMISGYFRPTLSMFCGKLGNENELMGAVRELKEETGLDFVSWLNFECQNEGGCEPKFAKLKHGRIYRLEIRDFHDSLSSMIDEFSKMSTTNTCNNQN